MVLTDWKYPQDFDEQDHRIVLSRSPKSCSFSGDDQKAHPWINHDNLRSDNNNSAQCGKAGKTECNISTAYGVAGFRNICPIAGYCGTYPYPAYLMLLKFKFGIPDNAIINTVEVQYRHGTKGVNVATGNINDDYPKFDSSIVAVDFEGVGAQSYEEPNGPKKGTEGGYTVKKKFNINKKVDPDTFVARLSYPKNGNTNPGIIYLREFKVRIDYTPADPILSNPISTNGRTSKISSCADVITQSVICTGQDGCINNVLYTLPNGCTQIGTTSIVGNKKTIQFKDLSGISGSKNVVWKVGSKSLNNSYNVTLPPAPQINIPTTLTKHIDLLSGITINTTNSCPNITGYIDTSSNPVDVNTQSIKDKIMTLTCGIHTIYFIQNNSIFKTVKFTLLPINFNFSLSLENSNGYNESNELNDTGKLFIQQNNYIGLKPSYLRVINDSTYNSSTPSNILNTLNNSRYSYEFSLYTPGQHKIQIEYDNGCENQVITFNFFINPTVQQKNEKLLIQVEDGTSVQYNSIAILEGDCVKDKVNLGNIESGFTFNDLDLKARCVPTRINNEGFIDIELTYTGSTEESLVNLPLEMNLEICDTDYETGINESTPECDCINQYNQSNLISAFLEWNNTFNNLIENFNEINNDIINNVTIQNILPDSDLEGIENVYLLYKEVKRDTPISVRIPFISINPKIIYLSFYINGVQFNFTNLTMIENDGIRADYCDDE